MRSPAPFLLPLLALLSSSIALADDAAVDIRAVGDSAFVAGNAEFGAPPAGWVERHLENLESLRSPDVNFLNLEGAVTRSCKRFYDKPFMFAVSPDTVVQFARWGFNLIGLANNHTQDCQDPSSASEAAKAQDLVRKDVPGIAMHGVAADLEHLTVPAILTVKGVRIGMVSIKAWPGGKADNMGNFDNRHELLRALRDADVDVRILSLHGGTESARHPHAAVIELAREFIARYGGDLVFAHHPHVIQGIELLQKPDGRAAAIFYSLGNHLHDGLSEKGDGMMARVSVGKGGVDADSVAAYPLANSNTNPGPLARGDLPQALATLRSSSAAVASRALPPGLRRLTFAYEPTFKPAPGVRLVTGAGSVGSAARAPGKATAPSRLRTSRWVPPQLPPARWIPPQSK